MAGRRSDRVMVTCLLSLAFIAGAYVLHLKPYVAVGGRGGGPLVRLPGGGCTVAWLTEHRVNRFTGIEESKYTDAMNPQNSHGWQAVSPQVSRFPWYIRLLP